jgi:hypothetical protein
VKPGFAGRTVLTATTLLALPGIAFAQAQPGSELMGQPVQVTTNGVSNTVYLDQGGAARIVTAGGKTVTGTWTAANGQLCLSAAGAQECWPYNSPFQAGQPQTLTSSCNASSTWLAAATNTPPPPPSAAGERGH